jgi:hypothetical protein
VDAAFHRRCRVAGNRGDIDDVGPIRLVCRADASAGGLEGGDALAERPVPPDVARPLGHDRSRGCATRNSAVSGLSPGFATPRRVVGGGWREPWIRPSDPRRPGFLNARDTERAMSQENVEIVRRVLKSRRDRGIIAREQGDERRVLMKLRLSLAVVACVVGASLIPATAVADRPTTETFSPAEEDTIIECDGTVLEFTGGLVVERVHMHELPSGRTRIIFGNTPRNVTVEDEEGTVYRVVGGIRGNFTTFHPEAEDPEDVIGFFKVNLNIIGPGGLFGKIKFTERAKRNGTEVVQAKGNCDFVDEE